MITFELTRGHAMKVKLLCNKEMYEKYKSRLENEKFEFTDEDFDLIVVDPNFRKTELVGKNERGEYEFISYNDIVFVESFGHEIIAHKAQCDLIVKEKLYEIEGMFKDKGFIRIHRSYVINKAFIKTIKPTFNTKFIITMKNGSVIEVSRSYYYIFKDSIGI